MVVSVNPTPVPFIPNFGRNLMPAALANAMVRNNGLRLQWMQSHVCPCTFSTAIPGSPEPACNTCHGRGRYWDAPQASGNFIGLVTFMHTSEAADEPGITTDPAYGQVAHAEPTITVPSDVHPVWDLASEFDAFVEVDAINRWGTVLTVGNSPVLPYQQNLEILNVTTYDSETKLRRVWRRGDVAQLSRRHAIRRRIQRQSSLDRVPSRRRSRAQPTLRRWHAPAETLPGHVARYLDPSPKQRGARTVSITPGPIMP